MAKSDLIALVLVILVALFFGAAFCFYRFVIVPMQKKFEEENDERQRQLMEREKELILINLRNEVSRAFEVELDTIQEKPTQDEIVRVLSFLATETSISCVKQDKAHRGEGAAYPDAYDNATANLKREWSKKRKLALQICPELEDRMPHFSEFEPLKSYNADHLSQKEARKNPV